MSLGEADPRSRGKPYLPLVGIVISVLLVGLGVALIFGKTAGGPTSATATAGAGSTEGLEADKGILGSESISEEGGRSQASSGRQGRAGGASTVSGAAAGVKLEATDRGVTPDSITIGVLIGEISGTATFGFGFSGFDPATEQRAYEAFIG